MPDQFQGYPSTGFESTYGPASTSRYPSLTELRKLLEHKLGIEQSSPLDIKMRVPEKAIRAAGQVGPDFWNSLAKVPHIPFEDNPETMVPLTESPYRRQTPPPSPSPEPNRFELQSGFDPAKTIRGTASYHGPMMNTEAALSGLKSLNTPYTPSKSNQFGTGFGNGAYDRGDAGGPSQADLYKMSFRDPTTTAPGANQYWGGQLKEQIGDEDFQTALQQKQQEAVQSALTSQNPAVQAALQQQAERGNLGVAKVQAEGAANRLEALQSILSSPELASRSINIAGVGGIGAARKEALNPALLQTLTRAASQLASQGSTTFGFTGTQPSVAQKTYEAALNAVIASAPPDLDIENLQGYADHVMVDPSLKNLPAADLISKEPGMSPEERAIFTALMTAKRGF